MYDKETFTKQAFIEVIKKIVLKEKSKKNSDIEKFISKQLQHHYKGRKVEQEVEDLNIRFDELNSEIKANLKLYAKDIITEEQYKTQNDSLQAELNEVKNQLDKINSFEKEIELLKIKYRTRQKFLETLDVENMTNGDLKKVIKRVYIDKKANPKDGISEVIIEYPQI